MLHPLQAGRRRAARGWRRTRRSSGCASHCTPPSKPCRFLLTPGREAEGGKGLVSEEAQQRLRNVPELDYLTHIVMRLYENKQCAAFPAFLPTCASRVSILRDPAPNG